MVKVFVAGTRDRFVDLVCAGHSLRSAAGLVGASRMSACRWWRESGRMDLELGSGRNGGLGAAAPAAAARSVGSRRALTSEDRAVIQAGRRRGLSFAAIADLVGRDKSVVWREVKRNSSDNGVYHATVAHRVADQSRRRPKEFTLIANASLCRRIETWLDDGWSPGLIAKVLAAQDDTDRVSHETIYQALYVQTRGHLRADLYAQLSLKRRRRVPRSHDRTGSSPYKEAFKISQRPAEADDRAVPGHWEGDLIVGPESKSAIGTLVERSTRFTILLHLPLRHDAATVAEAMIAAMGQLPEHLRRSITWDRGTELADYAKIQLALDTRLYFCDPHSPWQRGTNENTNRLLRHWFTKGTDLSVHTAEDLARVAATLNHRPRPTLDLQTPAMALNTLLTRAA
jgi:IS30 family transposase